MSRPVKVYIETSSQIGRIKSGAYVYLLEYILKNGEPYTKDGKASVPDTTKDRLTLMAMTEALARITSKDTPVVFIPSDKGIVHIINNGWHVRWKENGWKGSNNGTVKNADLWERFMELSEGRDITLAEEFNSYGKIMRKEVKEIQNADD